LKPNQRTERREKEAFHFQLISHLLLLVIVTAKELPDGTNLPANAPKAT
jgi:hypothetical protein